jgi:predicted short-subunit dehydrogenase-like oxidoreductase (DUF2520 family)
MSTTRKKRKPEVSIIGAGRLGTALAIALSGEGYPIGSLVARRRESARRAASLLDVPTRVLVLKQLADGPAPELLLIATPDDQIASVAAGLTKVEWDTKRKPIALHTSGALSAEVLSPLADQGWSIGSIHPLISVSESRAGARLFPGAYWCVEGDKRAVRFAKSLVQDLDGKSFSITSSKKPLYHAAAVMASGNMVALFDVALEMLGQCGVAHKQAQRILLPLLASTVDNLEDRDPVHALTGTFSRGDVETVKRHLEALRGNTEALELYRLLGRRSLKLAAKNQLDPKLVHRLVRIISK